MLLRNGESRRTLHGTVMEGGWLRFRCGLKLRTMEVQFLCQRRLEVGDTVAVEVEVVSHMPAKYDRISVPNG